jgi:uncharacterized protein
MELTLFVEHQCNLRCTYCYNGDKFNRPMDMDTVRKGVDVAMTAGPSRHLDVSFFGGEPLMRMKLLHDVVAYLENLFAGLPKPRPSLRFIMNTNGTLIDDEAIALMRAPRKFAVFVSLDGPREVHDRFRVNAAGRGSFDDVVAGIERLRNAGIPYQLVSVVSSATARELGKTVETLTSLGGSKVVLAGNFRDDWTEASVGELREGLRDAGKVWMEMFRAGTALPIEPMHTKILTHLKGGIPCPSRCMLGGTEMTVTPTGRIYPCAQMVGEDTGGELVIGHVDHGMQLDKIRELQRRKDRVETTCEPCALRDRCQSHCGCRHVALTGKLGEITATLCELEAAFIEAADAVAEQLFQERCQTFLDFYYKKSWAAARGGVLTQLRRSRNA